MYILGGIFGSNIHGRLKLCISNVDLLIFLYTLCIKGRDHKQGEVNSIRFCMHHWKAIILCI